MFWSKKEVLVKKNSWKKVLIRINLSLKKIWSKSCCVRKEILYETNSKVQETFSLKNFWVQLIFDPKRMCSEQFC